MTLFQFIDNNLSIPLFGAPLTVIGMAMGGALASFAYGEPEKSRLKMFFLVIANTFLATLAIVVLPAWLEWTWITPILQPPVAGGLAFVARWVIPVFVEIGPQLIRGRFGIGAKSTSESNQ